MSNPTRLDDRHVEGRCPACGHRSLFLGSGGYVTCSIVECKRPSAAADVLAAASPDHVVTLRHDGFSITHPLVERLDESLHDCPLDRMLVAAAGPPFVAGVYVVAGTPIDSLSALMWTRRSEGG